MVNLLEVSGLTKSRAQQQQLIQEGIKQPRTTSTELQTSLASVKIEILSSKVKAIADQKDCQIILTSKTFEQKLNF